MQQISLQAGETNFQLTQVSPRPLVYLDHWALRVFSSDQQLRKRFLELLEMKDGTLCVSWITVFEIVNHDQGESLNNILRFYDQLGNKFTYIQCDPTKVLENERNWKPGNQNPGLDTELAVSYIKYIFGKKLRPISFSQVVEALIRKKDIHGNMREKLGNAKQSLQQELLKHRQRYLKNPQSLQPKRQLKTPEDVTPYIFSETLKQYISGNSKFEPNDVPDIFHTIVPTSYCDFVLLDSKWVALVKNTRPKERTVAKIYSKKEMDNFWIDLEQFKSSSIGYPFEQGVST